MCRNLHALDTSHTRVLRVNLMNGLTKVKSFERGIGGPFIAKDHMTGGHAVL